MDGDGTCDYLDDDTDGDGTDDTSDAFPEDACADTDTDGDGMPDTLVAGCTTTLTEDGNDDYDPSAAPTPTSVCSIGSGLYASDSCTFTVSAGDELTIYMTTTSWASEAGLTLLEPGETAATNLESLTSAGYFSNYQTYTWTVSYTHLTLPTNREV